MSIVRMSGVTLVGPRQSVESVALRLLATGRFQPVPLDLLMTDRTTLSRVRPGRDNPYEEILGQLRSVWDTAGEPLPQPDFGKVTGLLPLDDARSGIRATAERLTLWEKRRQQLVEEMEELQAASLFVESLSDTGSVVGGALAATTFDVFFGRVTEDNFARLRESAPLLPVVLVPVLRRERRAWFFVFSPASMRDQVTHMLDSVYMTRYDLADLLVHTEEGRLETLRHRIENHKRAIGGLTRAAKEFLGRHRKELDLFYNRVYCMQRVYELCGRRGELGDMFVVSGWLPEDALPMLREYLKEKAPDVILLSEDGQAADRSGRTIPTLLRNLPFVRWFQDIVALYSLPSYRETDPSLLVALSFCFFFGFMFGDAGHGPMLIGAAALLKRRGMMKPTFAHILALSGVSSFVFGLLYGSVFGSENLLRPLWISPMKDANALIVAAMAVGIISLSVGILVNIRIRYKRREFGEMLFDGHGLAGLLLYWTMALPVWAILAGHPFPVSGTVVGGAIAALFLVVLFGNVLSDFLVRREARKKHRESPVVHTFSTLHHLLSFVSNTASFMRLAAFALNHAGLSMAVFMLADMVQHLPGGIIARLLILIAGHILIVSLEGLIVFIQTLRLEYYEFFGKFFSGGGRPFIPVTWSSPASGKTVGTKGVGRS
jgi:V/A-type H+-transporting ATPase subunit I